MTDEESKCSESNISKTTAVLLFAILVYLSLRYSNH